MDSSISSNGHPSRTPNSNQLVLVEPNKERWGDIISKGRQVLGEVEINPLLELPLDSVSALSRRHDGFLISLHAGNVPQESIKLARDVAKYIPFSFQGSTKVVLVVPLQVSPLQGDISINKNYLRKEGVIVVDSPARPWKRSFQEFAPVSPASQ